MARTLSVFILLGVGLVGDWACGSPLGSAGAACSADGDCAAGLSCLSIATASGSACTTQASICSKPCKADGDCVAVGPRFKCFAACGATGACGLTQ
jgi:hypothetical protein